MKLILSSFLITLLFSSGNPLDRNALYICPILGDKFEIFKIINDSVAIYSNYMKYPNLEYDFFEKGNINDIKKHFAEDKEFIKENTCPYKRKGDSLFFDRSDKVMLNLITFGVIKGERVFMKSLYRIFNTSTKKYDIIRTDEGLVFSPY